MNIVAAICNVLLFGFTCVVLLSEGTSKETGYIVLTLLLLLMPILSLVVIVPSGASNGWLALHMKRKSLRERRRIDNLASMSTVMELVAVIGNIALLGFVCWAFVNSYPHPEEDGFIPFALLSVLTPILSLVAIVCSGARDGWLGLPVRRTAFEERKKMDHRANQQDA